MEKGNRNKVILRVMGVLPLTLFALLPAQAQTLEECQQAAERNYPLIRQYDLISKTTDLTVANIQKGWLPQISATAQATLQSDVTAWPEQMQTLYQQMGLNLTGLKKDQYRVGIDVSQTVYDGGAISSQKEVARRQGEAQAAQTEANIYKVRKRVNEMYFGLLLLDEQIQLNHDLQEVLSTSEQKLASMLKNGTAAESDFLAVKAERLSAVQQMTSLQSQRQTLGRLLSTFCGIEIQNPSKPSQGEASDATVLPLGGERGGGRPELKAIDAQLQLTHAQEKALDAALKPRLGLFAQGYYGYPGLNMFDDMLRHRWTLNGIIGARLTWNIGALYTRKNDKSKLSQQRSALSVQRDVFLFDNNLEQMQEQENMERYRKLMTDDSEIISLRSSVRKAAESKLSHGIIDVNDLVKEINAENAARVQQSVHEIEMLKEIYNQKYTLNQ